MGLIPPGFFGGIGWIVADFPLETIIGKILFFWGTLANYSVLHPFRFFPSQFLHEQ